MPVPRYWQRGFPLSQHKYSLLQPIKQRRGQKQLYIQPYENLGGVSKGLYIKGYEVNWYYELIVSLNALNCKDIIQDHHVQMTNNDKIRIINVIHIRTISPFINYIIEIYYIEGMHKCWNIMSDDLTMSQRLHSYSVC